MQPEHPTDPGAPHAEPQAFAHRMFPLVRTVCDVLEALRRGRPS